MVAITCLVLSASILLIAFILWNHSEILEKANIQPITLAGSELYIERGKGNPEGNNLKLVELFDEVAVISSQRRNVIAADYPVLEYSVEAEGTTLELVFFWRNRGQGEPVHFTELHWRGEPNAVFRLENDENWGPAIAEFGLNIIGDTKNRPVTIKQLRFSPYTLSNLLDSVWSEWTVHDGWTLSTINTNKAIGANNSIITLTLAVAIWCGLAICLYLAWNYLISKRQIHINGDRHSRLAKGRVPGSWVYYVVAVMFLVSWLVLDVKWQQDVWRQLTVTKDLFSGKSHQEQHMVSEDAALYAYAKQLRENVLPIEPVRMLILHTEWRDLTRLRLMYYLLPHNIYNYNRYPDKKYLNDGDYILVIGAIPEVEYSVRDEVLRWRHGAVRVTRLDRGSIGTLYQYHDD